MTTLADFPISQRWPAANPGVIQLYSFPTPNGVKASIMLEETGLPYEAHKVALVTDTNSPEFLSLNPNNKIPAIIDPNGPGGAPLALFESGAILIYLAEKAGMLLGETATDRYQTLQWLMFQMGGVGPMFGQLGYFHKLAGAEIDDPRPRLRFVTEAKRLLGVLDNHLAGRDWLTDHYSIADIATAPWLRALESGYGAWDLVDWAEYKNLVGYLERFLDRPAVQKGLITPPRD